jgi:hypothetical protein
VAALVAITEPDTKERPWCTCISWPVAENGGGGTTSGREGDLLRVRGWFAPALQPDDVLRAALAASPYRLTLVNSLVATAKELVGRNQGRVLLLTDRAILVAGRRFWRRRFRALLVSYPIGSVPVVAGEGVLTIGDDQFFLSPTGFQLVGAVGTATDVALFLEAGAT